MRQFLVRCVVAGAAVLAAPVAWAEDVALIVSNDRYRSYPAPGDADAVLALAPRLKAAGFRTLVARNLDSETLAREIPQIARDLHSSDRFVVVLSGYFAFMNGQSWLVTTDADGPDGFTIGRYGLSLEALYNIGRAKPGDALIVAAVPEDAPDIGWRLRTGFRPGDIPQGVTVISGPAGPVSGFVAQDVLVPGQAMGAAADAAPQGVELDGYVPLNRAFLPASFPVLPPVRTEAETWQQAETENSVEGYRRYLQAFPNGRYAGLARSRIDDLDLTPEDRARLEEDSLNLSRDQRRQLQEYLTILGFDTRGVDGVFGPNTRSAMRAWQARIEVRQTGYLTANQVARLQQEGGAKAEELRKEAERRRLEAELRDREYWQQTGAGGSPEGLRTYLRRYPDGLFAEMAQTELNRIEREQRRQAESAERRAWDDAVTAGTVQSYRRYLEQYPNGGFAEEARARIQALNEPETPPAVVDAAQAEEESLNLDEFRRRLVEQQLAALGYDTAVVDGRFTRATRRALRQFQRDSNLPVTGFVTRATLVRLVINRVQ